MNTENLTPFWSVYRDNKVVAEFWTPGSADLYALQLKRADEASGMDTSKISYTVIENNLENDRGEALGIEPIQRQGCEPAAIQIGRNDVKSLARKFRSFLARFFRRD